MNLNKAREYYSAYFEGSLERGLRENFERALREEGQVQAEYRAFERTMRHLEAMKTVEVDTPDDLHDRIMARIDRHAWEAKQGAKPGAFAWWKVAVFVGAGALVIALSVMQGAKQPVNEAGPLSMPNTARMDVQAIDGGVVLTHPTVHDRTIVIRDAKGDELESIHLRNQRMSAKPLTNQSASAKLISVDIDGASTFIVLPGIDKDLRSTGKGNLKDMALEIANACGVPVVLAVKDPEASVTWKLDPNDGHGTATKALSTTNTKVELRRSRDDAMLLWITDN